MESTQFGSGTSDRLRDLLDLDPSIIDIVEFINILNDPGLDKEEARGILTYKWNNAAANLKKALELDARLYRVMEFFAQCASAVGAYEDAELLLKRAAHSYSYDAKETASLYSLYAEVLHSWGRHSEAELHFMKSIELDRSNPAYYFEYARFLYWQKMHNKAMKVIRNLVAIIPPGAKPRKILKQVLKGEENIDALFDPPASYGRLLRLRASNQALIEKLSGQLGTDKRPPKEFLEKTGIRSYTGIKGEDSIREELGRLESRIKEEKSDNPVTRMNEEYIDFLEGIRPGFEVMHCTIYFKDRCGKCTHPEGVYSGMALSDCPLDPAFYEYMRDTAKRAIDRIKEGSAIDNIEELRPE